MRRLHAAIAISAMATFVCSTATAADILAQPSSCSSCTSCAGQSEMVVEGCDSCASDCGSDCGGCKASRIGCGGCGCGICGRHRARIAAAGYFNCSCRGSYKFPVPPQYTYHWPGMYSQRFVTDYTSPYRFPPLEIPKFIPQEKSETTEAPMVQSTSTGLMSVPATLATPPAKSSSRPTPMSARIKRMYGLK